jgi:hypothetical protein
MSADMINMDDNILNSASLDPGNISFPGKDRLRKSPEDLPASQVEYLSIAHLEKDLSPEQINELELCIRAKSENREIFESVRKTKLIAPSVTYKNRNSLKKTLPGSGMLKIVSLTLSAAATIALLILAGIYFPHRSAQIRSSAASNIIQWGTDDTLLIPAPQPLLVAENTRLASFFSEKRSAVMPKEESIPEKGTADMVPEFITDERDIFPLPAIPSTPAIEYRIPAGVLMASINNFTIPEIYDGRNRVERFIAGIFREKVLRDSTYSDAPLKPYEIAAASIEGLNKLLDWNMELREITDGSGEVKSVSFSSALLSFNTPVRKTGE